MSTNPLEIKPLPYTKLDGISEKQLAEHFKLYEGYVKKYNELRQKATQVNPEESNGTYAEIREVNLEKVFALNAVKLHEAYFENMSSNSTECGGPIKQLIEQQWGSIEAWSTDFAALGLSARGWVVMAFDFDNARLENYICDAHNQGGVWNSGALLVLDVYEHAYFLDYATARKDYVASFMKLIDWSVVNERIPKWAVEKLTQ
ncbi:superoxide dismutase [Candidatus Saccharibacteria bacterium]|nr:superoxide dismutase [Candidatus Saccharibacteria bacterium]